MFRMTKEGIVRTAGSPKERMGRGKPHKSTISMVTAGQQAETEWSEKDGRESVS
jgi:hypothetical protein